MKTIFLFSGTKEGRMISEALSKASLYHTVFVATEYGKMVMEPSDFAAVNEGRLLSKEMKNLFVDAMPDIVIDATHPYAVEVTKNIKEACKEIDTEYIRVARNSSLNLALEDVNFVESTEEAVESLLATEGNILLTTGVKTLSIYMSKESIKERVYVRILPSLESLSLALETGIKPGHIIAQEGPFSVESNEALISQYDIKVLVTKNSGQTGGFIEKLKACENKNISVLVIDKKEDEGISYKEAIKKITGRDYKEKKVIIAGIGPGDIKTLTVKAKSAIEKADVIVGAQRMLDFAKNINHKAIFHNEYEATKILQILEKSEAEYPVVLMSGDTGFHSGSVKAKKVLEDAGFKVKLYPGISSISYFASLIGWEYSNARFLSLHGSEDDISEVVKEGTGFFAILSGPEDIEKVLVKLSEDWEVAIGFNLGYEEQIISITSPKDLETYTKKGLYVLAARKLI